MTRRPKSLWAALIAVVAVMVAFTGCSSNSDDTGDASSTTASTSSTESTAPELSGQITVSAAASLTDAFDKIKDEFIAAHPDVEITINYGSSGQLSTQIQEGAPVDVAAFADTTPMDALASADLLDAPAQTFARNRLVIVTKPGNPSNIKTLDDLATAGVIALCNENAPCGKFANQILSTAGVTIDESKVTRGQDVKATLGAVTEGDAVAGIVYETDATSVADKVARVEIPEDANVTAQYPIAVIKESQNADVAKAFVEFVLAKQGQSVLSDFGFLAP
ncbi:MAG: molybdate ABC transporter substrate-binding protein [Microthrixaceae bacterium]|nr:molybdate ABC transporter substrate-binding protein [Microthrixaceae bacterium]